MEKANKLVLLFIIFNQLSSMQYFRIVFGFVQNHQRFPALTVICETVLIGEAAGAPINTEIWLLTTHLSFRFPKHVVFSAAVLTSVRKHNQQQPLLHVADKRGTSAKSQTGSLLNITSPSHTRCQHARVGVAEASAGGKTMPSDRVCEDAAKVYRCCVECVWPPLRVHAGHRVAQAALLFTR